MKTVCIIQARLGSTRLPQKILLPLAGKSMLQNVVERVQRAKLVDEVVVATPGGKQDYDLRLEVAKVLGSEHLYGYGGDDNDLIGRFLGAAEISKADLIVRVCADNPCVESEWIDHLVEHAEYLKNPCRALFLDSENFEYNYDGFGGELYTLEMLEWMDSLIKNPLYREHPHLIWKDMGAYSYVGNSYPPGFRLDVNTEAEYEKLKDIYDHFGHNRFTVEEVMEYLNDKKSTISHASA